MAVQIDVSEMTLSEMISAMRAEALSCLDLVDLYLRRIEAYDKPGPAINSVLAINPRAREEAEERDAQLHNGAALGPLHGIPVIVKDQLETRGIVTTFGSAAFRDYVPSRDATVIEKLNAAGAIILAKTAMSDFATSWFGLSSAAGETKNPYALDRDPGGSSSGTGAGVAAGLGAVGIGEDTGGSIRVPASFNNLVGIRVTTGLISRRGMSPLVVFQDTAGPMARSVRDAVAVLDCITGFDPADPFTASTVCRRQPGKYEDCLVNSNLLGLRIGVLRRAFGPEDDPDARSVNEVINDALARMARMEATLVDPVAIADLPHHIDETTLYFVRSKFDINQFLSSLPDAPYTSIEDIYASGHFQPQISLFREIAEGPPNPADHPDYFRKVAARETFQREVLRTFASDDLDLIAYPTVRIPPPRSEDVIGRSSTASSATLFPTNTVIASHATLPAVSLPAGFTSDGLPVGIELIGKPFDEGTILRVAYALERDLQPRRRPATTPAL
jgi:amidase